MIILHLILGIFLGKLFGHYSAFIIGAIIADVDHHYLYFKHGFYRLKNFSWKRLVDAVKHEEKYGIKSKSSLLHSFLGLIIFTVPIYVFLPTEALYFGIAYLTHLILDWPDREAKYYFYPLEIQFKGFLPIWSKPEKVVTVVSAVVLFVVYLF